MAGTTIARTSAAVRVAIVQELLPRYRIPFFDKLREVLEAEGIELVLVHGAASGARATLGDEGSLPWAQVVRNRTWSVGKTRLVWQPALGLTRGCSLVIVEQANRQLFNYVALLRRAAPLRVPVAFWGHGANLQASSRTSKRAALKRWLVRQPDWWFAYTKGVADRVASLGVEVERITTVQNSVDTSHYAAPNASRLESGCVFIGGLHEHKRLEFLLEAAALVAGQKPTFTLTLIGDGPGRSTLEAQARAHPWVHYLGPLFGVEAAQVLSTSSLLLMPGLVGLSVIDSFAAATPMVTIDQPFHSPEFEYLRNGLNSIVCPEGASPDEYAQAVLRLLNSHGVLEQLRVRCTADAALYSLDAMVSNFATGIRAALDRPRRRGLLRREAVGASRLARIRWDCGLALALKRHC